MNFKKLFLQLVLVQAFLLATGVKAFSFSEPHFEKHSQKGDFFKVSPNDQAFLFEENDGSFFQNQLENDKNFSSDFSGIYAGSQSDFRQFQHKKFTSETLNFREILKTQIFPFHFFW